MYIPYPKKAVETIETKNSTRTMSSQDPNFKLFGFSRSTNMQWYEISNYIAWLYYVQVSVISHAVGMLSQSFAVIPPRIWDTVEKRFLTEDDRNVKAMELLDLLNMPSFGVSYNEFAKSEIPNYLVTGDLYLRIKAMNESKTPVEIEVINSMNVLIEQDSVEGKANKYTVSFVGGDMVFYKDEKSGRFYNNLKNQELWHTKIFNPLSKIKGLSPLNPLFYEIEQFISSAIHNGNLLKKGARPGGALTFDPEYILTDPNRENLRNNINQFYKGADNAGNILILDGGKDFKELSVSNKDMDFANLKKSDVEQMYRNLGIPMTLVLSESMTLDNFKQSVPVLFKMAVLPLADIFFEETNLFLMPRYDDSGRYELTYDPKDIQALEIEFNTEVDRQIKTGVLTLNEARELLGRVKLVGDAGNEIVRPSNLLPVGLVEEPKNTSKGIDFSKKEYSELLRKNNFSEDQIKKYVEKYYKEAENENTKEKKDLV